VQQAEDIGWFVPHQANLRILEAVAVRLGIPPGKVAVNVERYGNTSAATIPLVLSEWWQAGRLRRGDRMVLCGIGAGYTLGAVYLVWAAPPPREVETHGNDPHEELPDGNGENIPSGFIWRLQPE
jgi:predicted naringenin-chalcone synthase